MDLCCLFTLQHGISFTVYLYGVPAIINGTGRSDNTWSIVNEGIYAPAGEETISHSMSGWLKTGLASAIILLLTSAKKLLTAHKNCSEKNFLNKFAHGES